MTSLLGMTEARRRIYRAGIKAAADEARQRRVEERRQDQARIAAAAEAEAAIIEAARAVSMLSRPRRIIREIAEKHGLTSADILGPSRVKSISLARHEAVWTVKQQTHLSLPQLGKHFAGRDHTTMLNSIRRHQALIDSMKG